MIAVGLAIVALSVVLVIAIRCATTHFQSLEMSATFKLVAKESPDKPVNNKPSRYAVR